MPPCARHLNRERKTPKLQHKSQDFDNDVLLDIVKAMRRRVRMINRSYDIPYVAGYSIDGAQTAQLSLA